MRISRLWELEVEVVVQVPVPAVGWSWRHLNVLPLSDAPTLFDGS